MAEPSRSPVAGGALIALAILIGCVVGLAVHQPTLGFLAGTAIGVAAAIAIWLIDRRRPPVS